jgi:hypothetical protein
LPKPLPLPYLWWFDAQLLAIVGELDGSGDTRGLPVGELATYIHLAHQKVLATDPKLNAHSILSNIIAHESPEVFGIDFPAQVITENPTPFLVGKAFQISDIV